MTHTNPSRIISAHEIANYVVCPEAFRLKSSGINPPRNPEQGDRARDLKTNWIEKQDLSARLNYYAKVTYLLLVAITIIVFLFEGQRLRNHIRDPLPRQIIETDLLHPQEP